MISQIDLGEFHTGNFCVNSRRVGQINRIQVWMKFYSIFLWQIYPQCQPKSSSPSPPKAIIDASAHQSYPKSCCMPKLSTTRITAKAILAPAPRRTYPHAPLPHHVPKLFSTRLPTQAIPQLPIEAILSLLPDETILDQDILQGNLNASAHPSYPLRCRPPKLSSPPPLAEFILALAALWGSRGCRHLWSYHWWSS